MLKLFTRKREPVQLELFPITDVEKNINANCKRIAELNRIMDSWKVRPDHTNQLNLFGVGPYQMWTLMVDREGK
jgi:hypothetical protein